MPTPNTDFIDSQMLMPGNRPQSVAQTTSDVHAEYTRRLDDRRTTLASHTRTDINLGHWRLVTAGLIAVTAWLVFGTGALPVWSIAIPIIVFVGLWKYHENTGRHLDRHTRMVAFYEQALRRCEDRWMGTGTTGARFSSASHPYSDDLDIFGPGSVFELLCTARTRAGENCIAAWLTAPGSPEVIRARQAAIDDLRSRLDLREELALLGQDVRSSTDPEALAAWGAEPVWVAGRGTRIAAAFLSVCTVAALAGWALGLGADAFYIMAAIRVVFESRLAGPVKRVVRAVGKPNNDLGVLSSLLARIERERFQSPLLQEFQKTLTQDGERPSARIARLQTLIDYLDAARNMAFAPIGVILMWNAQFAFAIEAWRAQNGRQISEWLRIAGEFEAISALASYAYEHPEDSFPEIAEGEPCFVAEGLGHPLIPVAKVVRNDIAIGGAARLFIVSGSNMSGKSTLMRAIGVNTVLALAGGPVRARRLRLTPVQLGASIRTNDSLQAGISRFYAEITRLRQIVDITGGQIPLLFLLDEILHGTNSHDRRVGAEAVLRSLVKRGAVGLATTHDLALTEIAIDSTLFAVNVHFEDQLVDGKITFDNLLRPGVVEKSNAIELMRAVGLEI